MKLLILFFWLFSVSAVSAEILVATRTLRAKEIVGPQDVTYKDGTSSVPALPLDQVIGQEARIVLYAGRPIRPRDLRPPAVVQRNEIVSLIYQSGPLRIVAEGRSLGRGAEGEMIRAMNIVSRTTISGRVLADGSIEVN